MSFERKSMEYLVERMIMWAQGVSPKLTDFRVGSKVRTIMEAVALIIEEQYDRTFRFLRQFVEDNIYAVFSFNKVPVTYATGLATFSRSTPASQNYVILAGTALMSQASSINSPIKFYTTEDALLLVGTLSVNVPVVCDVAGSVGNIPAGTLTTFIQKPIGIESVTNSADYTTGKEEETKDSQKLRFQEFIKAQSRGVLQAVVYGAKQAVVIDTSGVTIESVAQAAAFEDLPARKGEVDLYVWNGVGAISTALRDAINLKLLGYYDTNGNPVYGFKPAGTMINLYSASLKYATIKLEVTSEAYTSVLLLKPLIEAEITQYFASLIFGQTVVQSALESNIKRIPGVFDIKLYLSTDAGATYTTTNIVATSTQIIRPSYPLTYV